MAYVRQNWENLPSTNTPITAERLNHMEDGIAEAWEHGGGSGAGETLRIGTILPYTGSSSELPTGYMLCDGAELSRTEYSDLFAVIGTSFGSGNGSSTFNLPNLKGKVLTGLDSNDEDFASVGTTGGEKEHTLTVEEMPSHNHDFYFYHISTAASSSGVGQVFDVTDRWVNTSKILNEGGSQPHNILQPYVVVNYIIKVTQSAPVQAQIVGTYTESNIDGYSTNYLNGKIGVELYNNDEGSTGTITLSDNVSNYSYLEVYAYNSVVGGSIYTKYDVSSGQDLSLFIVGTNGEQTRLVTTVYTVSGTTLTVKYTQRTTIYNRTIAEQGSNAENKITKIIGIK